VAPGVESVNVLNISDRPTPKSYSVVVEQYQGNDLELVRDY